MKYPIAAHCVGANVVVAPEKSLKLLIEVLESMMKQEIL
jgi:hypothetical protein